MLNNKNGISLITLIISIVVIIIMATVIIQKGIQRTDDARVAKHNQNIALTQEEVESYYYYQGGELPILDQTPYDISSSSTLVQEVTKNNDQNDNFYILDTSKLGKVGGNDGKGVGDDIYIVSATRHNVYYVKGNIIDGVIHHGVISKNDIKLSDITQPFSSEFDGVVNRPKLAAGMTPVRWNGSAWVDLNETEKLNASKEWYDYSKPSNKWANVRLKDGSLLVWIPRYTYSIVYVNASDRSLGGDINIKFSNGTLDKVTGGYKIHPAFYWGGWTIPEGQPMVRQTGGTEVTGIWVGKFEPSAVNGLQGTSGDNIQIISNKASWRGMPINDIFLKVKNMKNNTATYGELSDSDTHMLKNSEWGAITYLSKYALGTVEVACNPNSSYKTANGDIVTYKAQSSTGNEYGVYDMSGGTNECVAAYLDDSNAATNGNSLYNETDGKYKDKFPKPATSNRTTNYNALSQAYGHAIYETSKSGDSGAGWFLDYGYIVESATPWVIRGDDYNSTNSAGLFYFGSSSGSGTGKSFRVCIVCP